MSPNDEWVPCPECRGGAMLDLQTYDGGSSLDTVGVGKDPIDYWLFDWLAVLHDIYTGISESIRVAWKRRKVARLQKTILPRFPNSLICPRCLYVLRRS